MELVVNSVPRQVDSGPLTPLLEVLREELDVTGPKIGCETGGCGACTVMVDGEARRSCLTALCMVEGRQITTIEGIGTPEHLASLQQSFVHHYASQCGFCTSGMIVAAAAYLDAGGAPTPDGIAEALSGHYCRCTGYQKIIDAVAAAADAGSFDLTSTAVSPNATYVAIEGSGR